MDSYYLNDAVEKLNEFLSKADDPKFTGEVVFQRRAPHCWGPRGAELLQKLEAQIRKVAPARRGSDVVEIPVAKRTIFRLKAEATQSFRMA